MSNVPLPEPHMSNVPLPEPHMSNVPLPEPHHQSAANFNAPDEPFYTADQMHAHAAAVSAAKDERIKVLEDALRGMVIANERHSFLRVGDALTAARAALEKP